MMHSCEVQGQTHDSEECEMNYYRYITNILIIITSLGHVWVYIIELA